MTQQDCKIVLVAAREHKMVLNEFRSQETLQARRMTPAHLA